MKRTIIISESQLNVIHEFENKEILHADFENKLKAYLKELREHPLHPKFDDFFKELGLTEKQLQNKLLNLGMITKKEGFSEPENAEGKKHSMHTKSFTVYGKNYKENIDKLYNELVKNRKQMNECEGCAGDAGGFSGGALGGDNVNASTTDVSGGITLPAFGGVIRKKAPSQVRKKKKKSHDITKQKSNVNMKPALERNNKRGISVTRIK